MFFGGGDGLQTEDHIKFEDSSPLREESSGGVQFFSKVIKLYDPVDRLHHMKLYLKKNESKKSGFVTVVRSCLGEKARIG